MRLTANESILPFVRPKDRPWYQIKHVLYPGEVPVPELVEGREIIFFNYAYKTPAAFCMHKRKS